MSAKGLLGSLVDAKRAGTMTVKACDKGNLYQLDEGRARLELL